MGYVRPGWPSDGPEGKVIFAGEAGAPPSATLGGTIYFKVYERTRSDAEDPYGLGLNLSHFRPGVHFSGSPSAHLKDLQPKQSRYLYLYQVVNDRKPPRESLAQSQIESVSVRLHVPLEEISSWGHVQDASFAVDHKTDKEERSTVRPVSYSGPVWDSGEPGSARLAFLDPAPRQPIRRRFEVQKLLASKQLGKVEKGVAVTWETLDPPRPPSFVMLLGANEEDEEALPTFRAIWSNGGLDRNQRSTVFGFTSPHPPMFDKVGGILRSPAKLELKNPIKPAATSKEERLEFVIQAQEEPGQVIEAAGEAPTPRPDGPPAGPRAPGLTSPASGAAAPGLGSSVPVGGGGGGGPVAPPNFGMARAPMFGGGGGFGGGGAAQETRESALRQGQGQDINFNVTQTNNQAQSQDQNQGQTQGQSQSQGQAQAVIPAPPALLLAALGLPALYFMRRWRTA